MSNLIWILSEIHIRKLVAVGSTKIWNSQYGTRTYFVKKSPKTRIFYGMWTLQIKEFVNKFWNYFFLLSYNKIPDIVT